MVVRVKWYSIWNTVACVSVFAVDKKILTSTVYNDNLAYSLSWVYLNGSSLSWFQLPQARSVNCWIGLGWDGLGWVGGKLAGWSGMTPVGPSCPRSINLSSSWLVIGSKIGNMHKVFWGYNWNWHPITSATSCGPKQVIRVIRAQGQGPRRVAQLVRASSQYVKVAGSIWSQDTYKNQPMNA